MIKSIFTIGYTGFTLQEFIAKLTDSGVECLIDTREIPISRKKGFSKTALRENLEEAGISYQHFRLLGSPRVQRHEVRETGNYLKFFSEVRKHIATPEAMLQLREAVRLAEAQTSCLMCCCPDWTLCHRSCLVESIADPERFKFEHLSKVIKEAQIRRAA